MRLGLLLLFFLFGQQVFSQDTLRTKGYYVIWDTLKMKERKDWTEHFTSQGAADGTLVIYDQQKGKYQVYNRQRMVDRFIPASTFKIYNSLIALETGAVKSEKETFKWDGFDRGNGNWNRDQDMAFAFKNSTVWYYQQLARKIGWVKMEEHIKSIGYGNKNIDGGLEDFWIKGKLRISAKEQVELLKKLQADMLPFKKEHMLTVKKIMIQEETENYILRAKTGWGEQDGKNIGWYVGYVEKPRKGSKEKQSDFWYFALNIDMDANRPESRMVIVKRVLAELKVI
ncbi:MAG TPA: class D beta-lactamase [Flavobacteriales bacterium]|nr:class D beta-lactamase [Flavobacteriales bacterium]HRE75240.1 class D beta-lactamase [Flavobacteriales bacterium]HRJ39247.1 class D beta-lactamase [Flavobacteriales bacterium]